MKFGYEGSYLVEDIENHGNDLNLAYQFNGGRPSQLTESLRVFKQKDRVRTAALYVQDQWTRGRMTLQGALRFDNARSYSPEQTIGPALINGQTFLSTPLSFPRTDGVNFKDLSPRGGLALDVFGNGKTAAQGQLRQIHGSGEQSERELLDLQSDCPHRDDGVAHVDRQRHAAVLARQASVTSFLSAISPTTRPTANAPRRPRRRSVRRR